MDRGQIHSPRGKVMRRILLESVVLVVIFAISASTFVGTAAATVPTIVSVRNTSYTLGTGSMGTGVGDDEVFVNVTINHPGPSATHYIDWIEVDFLGEVKQLAQTPQSSDSFSVNAYWGRVADWKIPKDAPAKVRAHCTQHGWSAWTSGTPIPEFPVATIVAFIALAASLFILRSKPTIAQFRKARIKP
jgi:desulfoferrodoxin (superoxide reductase-like protein)